MLRWIQFKSQQSVCNKFLRQTLHASWEDQDDTFSKSEMDLRWILYNKPRMVATFFLQWTTAFILFLIVPLFQISCFWKTKEKQYAKYDLNKRIAARLIWQLVIHSCVIFAYIISRRDGENNGFLAGVSLSPPSSRTPRVSLAPKIPFPFPFKCLPCRLHPCWTDRITWVQKLDDVVWSDASWDVRMVRFPYNSNIYYACSNFILLRTNSLSRNTYAL